jgi:outer membrane protein TolC
MKQILLIISFVLLAIGTSAQYLSQNEYRKKVLAYNQEIKMAKDLTLSHNMATKSVKTDRLPELSLEGNSTYQFRPPPIQAGDFLTITQEGWIVSTNLMLMQTIYAGGAINGQINVAEMREKNAAYMENSTIEDILLTADIYYWNLSTNQELLKITNDFYGLVNQLYDVVNARFEDGLASRKDLIMVETRKKEAEFQILSAEKNFILALQTLNIFIGNDPGMAVVVDSIQNSIIAPVSITEEEALNARYEYQVSLNNVEIAREEVKLAASNFRPYLMVGVQETFGTKPLNTDNSFIFNTLAVARLNVPIFDWNNRGYRVSQARLAVNIREQEKSLMTDNILLEINQTRTDLELSLRQIQLAEDGLKIASENLDLNYLSYYEGQLPILDVLSAQLSWINANRSLLTSNLQYKIALTEYLKAMGLMYTEYLNLTQSE